MGFLSDLSDKLFKSGSSETTKNQPAERDDYQWEIWQRFYELMGSPEFDAKTYLTENPEVAEELKIDPNNIGKKAASKAKQHYENYGKAAGLNAWPEDSKVQSLWQRLVDDTEWKKASDQAALSSLAETGVEKRQASYGQSNALQNLIYGPTGLPLAGSNPIQITGPGLSGAPLQFTTGTQRRAHDNAVTDLESRKKALQEVVANKEDLIQKQNIFNNTYTPNVAQNQYFDILQQLATAQDKLRYSLPSATNTATTDPSGMEKLGGMAQIGALFI